MATILVVDDDADIRDLVAISLRMAGHTVREAHDGEAALALLATEEFSMVVLDVTMPTISGLEVVRRLRSSVRVCQPLVLMLSAMSGREDVRAGLEAGADEYAVKPFRLREINAQVDRMLCELRYA